jgi:Holliday junction DNA helicase RuvA
MITKITGVLNRVLDDEARVQVGPLEYQVLIPETVRMRLQARRGQEVTFHVTEFLEGNGGGNRFIPRRIGFLSEPELDFFDLFCTVDKIGVKKALKAMCRPVRDIAGAIHRQDARWLSTLPGIGAQTADQIIISLKKKVIPFATLPAEGAAPAAEAAPVPDAVVEDKPAAKKGKGKKGDAEPAPSAPELPAADGKLIEEVYEALMGLGLNPVEARAKLDGLLTCGKPFRSLSEAITMIFSTKG